MKAVLAIVGVVVAAIAVYLGVTLIDVDQTQEAQLPDVDVTVEGGQAPAYDVETGEIEVGTEDVEVTVPEVEVTTTEQTISVPNVDIEAPEADSPDSDVDADEETTAEN